MSLYQGLYDVIVKNPDLTPKILQLLNQHADNLNLNNPNSMVAMDLGEAVFEDDGEVKLVVSKPYLVSRVFFHAVFL